MFWRKKRPKPGNLPGAPHTRVRHTDISGSFPNGLMLNPQMWDVRHDLVAKTGNAGLDLRIEESARGLEPRLSGESFTFPCDPGGKTLGFRFEQQCQALVGQGNSCIWSHSRTVHRALFDNESLTSYLLEAREELQQVYLHHLLAVHSPALVDARVDEMRENVTNGGCLLLPKPPSLSEVAADPKGKLGLPEEVEREKECSYCGLEEDEVLHLPCLMQAREEGVDSIFPPTEAWQRKKIEEMNRDFAEERLRGSTTGFAATEHELLANGFTQEDIENLKNMQSPHEAKLSMGADGEVYVFTSTRIQRMPPDCVRKNPDGSFNIDLQAEIFPSGRSSPGFEGVVSQPVEVSIVGKQQKRRKNRETGGGQAMPV